MAGYHRETIGVAIVHSDENRIEVKDRKPRCGTVSTLKLAIKVQELWAQNTRRNLQTVLIGLVASEFNNSTPGK
jgi:hypothetical protein